jgi:hypothetical protein
MSDVVGDARFFRRDGLLICIRKVFKPYPPRWRLILEPFANFAVHIGLKPDVRVYPPLDSEIHEFELEGVEVDRSGQWARYVRIEGT